MYIGYTHILPFILTVLYLLTILLHLFETMLPKDTGFNLDIVCWFAPVERKKKKFWKVSVFILHMLAMASHEVKRKKS